MDHLIATRASQGLHFEVPVLSTANYDGGDFLTYPNRQGWGPRPVSEWQAIFQNPSPDFLAFLQRWLYFGFIHVRLCPVDVKATVTSNKCDSSGHPILSTEMLPQIALHSVEAGLAKSFRGKMAVRQCDMINAAFSFGETDNEDWRTNPDSLKSTESLLDFIHSECPPDPRHPDQILANMVLYDFGSVDSHWTPRGHRDVLSQGLTFRRVIPGSYIWTRLRQRGWCPSDIMVMEKDFTISALVFLANLAPPRKAQDHCIVSIRDQGEQRRPEKSLCNELRCAHQQLSDDTYKTKHVDGCPGCDDVVADPTISLKHGKIPLILSVDSGDDSPSIEFVDADIDTSYVAISHVWSDGLGNVQRNALPRCQLLRLSNYIRNLPGKAADIVLF